MVVEPTTDKQTVDFFQQYSWCFKCGKYFKLSTTTEKKRELPFPICKKC